MFPSFMFPHTPKPSLFPYTTLFRSITHWSSEDLARQAVLDGVVSAISSRTVRRILDAVDLQPHRTRSWRTTRLRSEEHTSELQSHVNLVCRLLLEKKKKYCYKIIHI